MAFATEHRHRAGDARILWEFAQCVYREVQDEVSSGGGAILRRPSLPPQLPADALSAIPESPGVLFLLRAQRAFRSTSARA
jgi:hypothetical protein